MTVADIRFDWNPSMDAVPESLRGYPAEMGEKGGRGYTLSAMSGCVREMVRRLASRRGTPRLGYVAMCLKAPESGADRVYDLSDFTIVELPWDPLPVFDADDLGRKEMALDIIRAGMGGALGPHRRRRGPRPSRLRRDQQGRLREPVGVAPQAGPLQDDG